MITITVEGGVIQHITGIPAGCKVKVIDFDTDGVPDEDLVKLHNGDRAIVSTWPSKAKRKRGACARH